MITAKRITFIVIIILAVLIALYDLFALWRWGIEGTISVVVLEASRRWPAIPFGLGFLMGHLFAGITIPRSDK